MFHPESKRHPRIEGEGRGASVLAVLSALVLLVLSCLGGCDATTPGSISLFEIPPDHFPLAVGNKWTYDYEAILERGSSDPYACIFGWRETGQMVWEVTGADASGRQFEVAMTMTGEHTQYSWDTPPPNFYCVAQHIITDFSEAHVFTITAEGDSVRVENPGTDRLCYGTLSLRRYYEPGMETQSTLVFPGEANCIGAYSHVQTSAGIGIMGMYESGGVLGGLLPK